jgi:hypothetical protein
VRAATRKNLDKVKLKKRNKFSLRCFEATQKATEEKAAE